MANVAQGDLVYWAVNDGLMEHAPLFGQVIDIAGTFTAQVAVQLEQGGLLLLHDVDTDDNKLVIHAKDVNQDEYKGRLMSHAGAVGVVKRTFFRDPADENERMFLFVARIDAFMLHGILPVSAFKPCSTFAPWPWTPNSPGQST